MLKRFMTWLLNQFQKVINTFKKGSPVEKENRSSAIANRLSSDLSSQRQPNPDEPVALRESSVAPAKIPDPSEPAIHNNVAQNAVVQINEPEYVSNDSPVSADTVADTHQRIDVAPAALPEETITTPGFPTEVSELISATVDSPVELKPTYPDEHPPEIHDLLPAIEPDEPEPEIVEVETTEETKDLLENTQAEPEVAISEQGEKVHTAGEIPAIESAERVSGEEITLFSFNITEAEESDAEHVEGEEKEDNSVEAEPTSEPEASTELSTSLPYEPAVIERPANVQQPEPNASTEEISSLEESASSEVTPVQPASDSRSDEPINPWLTAVSTKSKAAVAEPDASKTTHQPKEQEQKAGTVKLLFKIKQGNFHGYIAPHDGSKDILFHQKYINADIFDQIERGSEVTASIRYIEGKVYATHVALA